MAPVKCNDKGWPNSAFRGISSSPRDSEYCTVSWCNVFILRRIPVTSRMCEIAAVQNILFHRTTANKMLLNNALNDLWSTRVIPDTLRIHNRDGSTTTHP